MDLESRRTELNAPWWRSAVVYQIYPRSFADSDGDGVGDRPREKYRAKHPGFAHVGSTLTGSVWHGDLSDRRSALPS